MPLSVTQAIEIADKRTERRATNSLDLRSEFWMAMTELYLEKRFPWRRMSCGFKTSVGVNTYDLSAGNANDFDVEGGVAPYFYEAITVWRVDSPQNIAEIDPIFGERDLALALEAQQACPPSRYFFLQQGANYQNMFLGAPADGVYGIRVNFWGAPDPNVDNAEEDIPLLPPQGHHVAPIALERSILRFLYGEEDPRYDVCDKRYDRGVAQLMKMGSYTTNRSRSWAVQDHGIRAVDASGFPQDDNYVSRSD